MKQETVNTFSEGLVMDLNPMTTPNNVLTDCINGTILTYNGNELVLQNDIGNYKLENAKLSTNFIPIGVKEYGGIIYIVSYNSLTKETEIGSYPSPETINTSGEENESKDESTLVPLIKNDTNETYENIIKKANLVTFTGNNIEDMILNPNDEYKFTDISEINNNFPFQTLDFYILDLEKKLHKIDNNLINLNSAEFEKIKWDISGLLTAKYTIGDFLSYNVYIRNLKYDKSIKTNIPISFDVSFNLEISDKYLLASSLLYNSNKNYLSFNIKYESDDIIILNVNKIGKSIGSEIELKESIGPEIELKEYVTYNNYILFYETIKVKGIIKTSIEEIVNFKSAPYIKWIDINPHIKPIIKYDHLKITNTININDKFNTSNIKALNYFKYTIYDNKVVLNFDINTNITDEYITLKYKIFDINSNVIMHNNLNKSDIVIGSNVLELNFGIIDADKNLIFAQEEIYIFRLEFYYNNILMDTKQLINDKILITSVLFNNFSQSYSDFNEISAKEWLKQTRDYFNTTLTCNNINTPVYNYINDHVITEEEWITQLPKYVYVDENIPIITIKYNPISEINCDINYTFDLNRLNKGMWSKAPIISNTLYLTGIGDNFTNILLDNNKTTYKIQHQFKYNSQIKTKTLDKGVINVPKKLKALDIYDTTEKLQGCIQTNTSAGFVFYHDSWTTQTVKKQSKWVVHNAYGQVSSAIDNIFSSRSWSLPVPFISLCTYEIFKYHELRAGLLFQNDDLSYTSKTSWTPHFLYFILCKSQDIFIAQFSDKTHYKDNTTDVNIKKTITNCINNLYKLIYANTEEKKVVKYVDYEHNTSTDSDLNLTNLEYTGYIHDVNYLNYNLFKKEDLNKLNKKLNDESTGFNLKTNNFILDADFTLDLSQKIDTAYNIPNKLNTFTNDIFEFNKIISMQIENMNTTNNGIISKRIQEINKFERDCLENIKLLNTVSFNKDLLKDLIYVQDLENICNKLEYVVTDKKGSDGKNISEIRFKTVKGPPELITHMCKENSSFGAAFLAAKSSTIQIPLIDTLNDE